jgi:hypothetical protein
VKRLTHQLNESVFVMNLKNIKNIAFTLSLVAFAIGFSDGGESMFWYMGRPVGAILFGIFMIFMVLEKESLLLDEQRLSEKKELDNSKQSASHKRSNKENCAPALTTAASH